MEVQPRRIRDILDAHNRLVRAYNGVLREATNQPFNVKLPVEIPNPFLLKDSFQGRYERMAFISYAFIFTIRWPIEVLRYSIITFLSLFKSSHHFEPRVLWRRRLICWRPFLRYLIILHIRRNYNKLYGLYLQEILVQSTEGESKELLSDFRQAADDLKKYIDNMPGSRKFFLSLIAALSPIAFVLSSVGWLLDAVGIDVRGFLSQYLTFDMVFGAISLSVMMAFLALFPFSEAFTMKRQFLVRPTNLAYYVAGNVFLRNGPHYYEGSLYKLEDDLYARLGAIRQKPEEIAFDLLFLIPISIIYAGMFAALAFLLLVIAPPSVPEEALLPYFIIGIIALLSALAFAVIEIIMRILSWRNRRKYNMT